MDKLKAIFNGISAAKRKDEDESNYEEPLCQGNCTIVKAMYNFKARDAHQLSFKRGDKLEIKAKSWQDWWLAENLTTRGKGYIPVPYVKDLSSPESNDWYFANISREESELLLMTPNNSAGAFLVRNSSAGHGLSLSIRVENDEGEDRDIVHHYKIYLTSTGLFYIKRNRVFMTLNDVVDHYLNHDTCTNLRPLMKYPCQRHTPGIHNLTIGEEWEIKRESLQMVEEISEGQSGTVWKAKWNNRVEVAVKMLKVEDDTMPHDDFIKETSVMKSLRHNNILILYGVCTTERPRLIVMEYMSEGSLLDVLRGPRGQFLEVYDLIHFAFQVANGMKYLESKQLVHRDLAARNVLIGETLVCKIADFGLARITTGGTYNVTSEVQLPVRWIAPEALRNIFTIKSDIWSYAILLTEIFTYGKVPYADLRNDEVLRLVLGGCRMECPPRCPQSLYELMKECWHIDMEKRPTFDRIYDFLVNFDIGVREYSEPQQ